MNETAQHNHCEIDHIGLVVPNLGEAVSFFTDHLGAKVEFSMDRFIDESGASARRLGAPPAASFALSMLSVGEARIELLQWWPSEPPRSAPNTVGAAHLALSVDDIQATYAKLATVPGVRALGSPVTFGEGPTPGLSNAFVSTEWGLLIELMSWPQASAQPPSS